MGHSSQDLIPVNPSEISKWISKIIMEHLFFHILDAFEPNYHKLSIECMKKKQTSTSTWFFELRILRSKSRTLGCTKWIKELFVIACFNQHSKNHSNWARLANWYNAGLQSFAHSRIGQYFYSNTYGCAPRGAKDVKRTGRAQGSLPWCVFALMFSPNWNFKKSHKIKKIY